MPPADAGVLARHHEIRAALRFFLDSWYKHKQAGSLPNQGQVIFDYVKFKSLGTVAQELQTRPPQVFHKERAPPAPGRQQRGDGEGRQQRGGGR